MYFMPLTPPPCTIRSKREKKNECYAYDKYEGSEFSVQPPRHEHSGPDENISFLLTAIDNSDRVLKERICGDF